jgi:hypothetical protein
MALKRPTRVPSAPQTPYDPLQFSIRARNDSDHSEYIPKTQVTPELYAEVCALVDSRTFDFSSLAGFVRWAVVNGLEKLKTLKPEYPSNIAIIRAMEIESARLQTRISFMDHIERKAKEAFELTGRGMHMEAARHVYTVLSQIRKMDPSDPWRAYFEAEIKKRFGKLLTRGKIASHVPEKPKAEPQLDPDWTDDAAN